ncbi:ribonuclease H-like domain-containing protein [Candidatus Woesearchaeota archaeon]|nr:ribonuclease H-like domain-containing protein [Candidatus Woesearchaeota archaeon]
MGYKTEKEIWDSGIKDWESFDPSKLSMPSFRAEHIEKFVKLSIESLKREDYSFFSSRLPANEHWRCLRDFSKIAYLDIETTGLDRQRDDITIIGVYDGRETRQFINGKNLEEFNDYISDFPMIVTFNGACFDLPFISSKAGIGFGQVHLDLRFALKRLGFSGGLKSIEKDFGIRRSQETEGIDGLEAVRLWHSYKRGDKAALETLKRYNEEDVMGLKILGMKAYDMLKENASNRI